MRQGRNARGSEVRPSLALLRTKKRGWRSAGEPCKRTRGMSPNAPSSTQAGSDPLGPRTVIERPPPGLARGKYPVPAWVVSALGAAVVLIGIVYLARRWRTGRKR